MAKLGKFVQKERARRKRKRDEPGEAEPEEEPGDTENPEPSSAASETPAAGTSTAAAAPSRSGKWRQPIREMVQNDAADEYAEFILLERCFRDWRLRTQLATAESEYRTAGQIYAMYQRRLHSVASGTSLRTETRVQLRLACERVSSTTLQRQNNITYSNVFPAHRGTEPVLRLRGGGAGGGMVLRLPLTPREQREVRQRHTPAYFRGEVAIHMGRNGPSGGNIYIFGYSAEGTMSTSMVLPIRIETSKIFLPHDADLSLYKRALEQFGVQVNMFIPLELPRHWPTTTIYLRDDGEPASSSNRFNSGAREV